MSSYKSSFLTVVLILFASITLVTSHIMGRGKYGNILTTIISLNLNILQNDLFYFRCIFWFDVNQKLVLPIY